MQKALSPTGADFNYAEAAHEELAEAIAQLRLVQVTQVKAALKKTRQMAGFLLPNEKVVVHILLRLFLLLSHYTKLIVRAF